MSLRRCTHRTALMLGFQYTHWHRRETHRRWMSLLRSHRPRAHRPKRRNHTWEMPAVPPATQETGKSRTESLPFLFSSPGHPLTRPGRAPAPTAWHTEAIAQHSRQPMRSNPYLQIYCPLSQAHARRHRANHGWRTPFFSEIPAQPAPSPKRQRPSRANGCAREGPALYVRCEPQRPKPPGSARLSYAWASRNLQTLLPHSRPSVMAMPSEQPGMGVTYS